MERPEAYYLIHKYPEIFQYCTDPAEVGKYFHNVTGYLYVFGLFVNAGFRHFEAYRKTESLLDEYFPGSHRFKNYSSFKAAKCQYKKRKAHHQKRKPDPNP